MSTPFLELFFGFWEPFLISHEAIVDMGSGGYVLVFDAFVSEADRNGYRPDNETRRAPCHSEFPS